MNRPPTEPDARRAQWELAAVILLWSATLAWLPGPLGPLLRRLATGLAVVAAAPLAVVAGILGIVKALRQTPADDPSSPGHTERVWQGLVRKRYAVAAMAFFVCVPLAGLVFDGALVLFAGWWRGWADARYLIGVVDLYWVFPATSAGLAVGTWWAARLVRRLLPQDPHAGFRLHVSPMDWALYGFLGVLSVALWWGGLNDYVRVSDAGIGIKHFNELAETFHPYHEVVSLDELSEDIRRQDEPVRMVVYEIGFADGTSWRSAPLTAADAADRYGSAMAWVARQSGRPLQHMTAPAAP